MDEEGGRIAGPLLGECPWKNSSCPLVVLLAYASLHGFSELARTHSHFESDSEGRLLQVSLTTRRRVCIAMTGEEGKPGETFARIGRDMPRQRIKAVLVGSRNAISRCYSFSRALLYKADYWHAVYLWIRYPSINRCTESMPTSAIWEVLSARKAFRRALVSSDSAWVCARRCTLSSFLIDSLVFRWRRCAREC